MQLNCFVKSFWRKQGLSIQRTHMAFYLIYFQICLITISCIFYFAILWGQSSIGRTYPLFIWWPFTNTMVIKKIIFSPMYNLWTNVQVPGNKNLQCEIDQDLVSFRQYNSQVEVSNQSHSANLWFRETLWCGEKQLRKR